jgi:hypothetical protein
MGGELSHAEVTELLGAYALDALVADESMAVIAHLRDCLLCQTEVAEYREVAAFIAPATTAAPERLWDQIAGSLEEVPPPLQLPNVRSIDSSRRRNNRAGTIATAAVAVAVVAVVGVLGIKVADNSSQINQMADGAPASQLSRATAAALADPGARLVDLKSSGTKVSARAVLLPDGTGYVLKNNLPPLDRGRTYQLWAVVGDSKISVGVLGPAPGTTGFKAAGDVSALAITQEQAGGVVASNQTPVVVGTLS